MFETKKLALARNHRCLRKSEQHKTILFDSSKKISVGFGTSFTYSFMDGNFNLRFTFFFDFLMAQLDNGKI